MKNQIKKVKSSIFSKIPIQPFFTDLEEYAISIQNNIHLLTVFVKSGYSTYRTFPILLTLGNYNTLIYMVLAFFRVFGPEIREGENDG